MKKTFIFILLLTSICCKPQDIKSLTFDSLSEKLIDYLYLKGEIDENRSKKLKNKEYKFHFVGFFNKTEKGELKDGVYTFSSLSSHSQLYYVIVENEGYQILDFSKREELDDVIKKVLDFSERKKYCVDITSELVISLVNSFYNYNKTPLNRRDLNCYYGIIDSEDLP